MVLVDRAREPLEELAADLIRNGMQAYALTVNLCDHNAGGMVENVLAERDLYCDVLVNSAGFGLFGPVSEIDPVEQMQLLDVNVRALTELTLRFLPGMVERGRGGIINLGSILSYTPGPYMAMYHASKAFVRSLSAALSTEVAGTGVTVTNLSPGVVRTAFLDPLPIKYMRLFKVMPRSNAVEIAETGWRGFRAGKRFVFPRLIDRLIAGLFIVLPDRAIPHLSAPVKRTHSAAHDSAQPAIVVTGASSGIGRELARVAARDGSVFLLVARSDKSLGSLAEELAQTGAIAHVLPLDLADRNAAEMIERALSERGLYGDVLVNSAGLGLFGAAAEISRAKQMQLLDVNVRALTELTLRLLPSMVRRGRGGVFNVGSIASYMPGPYMAMYHASKAYVRSLSAALAAELTGTGVTVTNLSPGIVRTPFFDRIPIRHTRLFKLLPRSNVTATAEAGWHGFRAGKRLVIPRVADRVITICCTLLPSRLMPRWSLDPKLPW